MFIKDLSAGLIMTGLLFPFCLSAESNVDGGQPAAYLKLGVGARARALGSAAAALGGDAYGFFYNPAVLSTLTETVVGSHYSLLSAGRSLQYLSAARPFEVMEHAFACGLSLVRFGVTDPIEYRVSNTPDPIRTFGDEQLAVGLSGSGWLIEERLSFGLTARFLSHQLGEASAAGGTLDTGLFYRLTPDLDLGLSLKNLLGFVSWSTACEESVAMSLHLGAAARFFDDRLAVTTELERNVQQHFKPKAGVEWAFVRDRVCLRLGLNDGRICGGAGLTRLDLGFGRLGLDWAVAADPLDGSQPLEQVMSLNLNFSLDETRQSLKDPDVPYTPPKESGNAGPK
jgi:hypothetical protein